MKKLSKILAVVLAISVIFGTVGFAADFSDVNTENKYYEPIKILSAFGIINGYEDGTFGPDKDVTRAEFSKMLMGAMASAGLGNTDPAGTPFTDLHDPTVAWAVGDIRTAYDLGIINGMTATTFEPKANVTYEQALKMIVCALNYGGQAEVTQAAVPGQPWYYGYLQTARSLGLTDNIVVLEGQPAKRAHIAQMVYNALEVNMLEKVQVQGGGDMYMQSNQNWLKDKLRITKSRGVLLADETNTMDEDGATARVGYALFTGGEDDKNVTVAKNNISLDGLLGKTVEYYYKTDINGVNNLVLAFNKSGSNPSIKVTAGNINNIRGNYNNGFVVEYYESDTAVRTKKLEVSAKPIISINGEVRTDVDYKDLTIESGSLEFISDGGSYNKINVEKFDTYVVKSVNKTDKYIVDMYKGTDSNLYIDDEDSTFSINMKNSAGNAITISSLSQYNVLTVKEGKGISNRTTLDIIVSTKNVSGNIKEIDDEFININGTEYKVSEYLRNNGEADKAKLSVGDSCKAYLDVDGRIAYIEKTASSSTYYGYIADAAAADDEVRFALISQKTPSMSSYVRTATRVRIDGESYSDPDRILEVLAASAKVSGTNIDNKGTEFSQLVKYTINNSGLITAIDTAAISSEEDADDETILKPYDKNKDLEKMTYKSSEFTDGSNKFRIDSSTQIFLVPENRTDFEEYGRKTSSFFKSNGTKYTIEAYNITGSLNTAAAVVVYATEDIEVGINAETPLFVITKISQKPNAEGNACDVVTGYEISRSGGVTANKELYTETVNVINGKYEIGDVFMYALDNKGYLTTDGNKFKQVLDVDGFNDYVKFDKDAEFYQGLLVGASVDGNKQVFVLALTDDINECGDTDIQETFEISTKAFFSYDSSKDSDKMIVHDESFDLTSLNAYNDTVEGGEAKAAKVFVYRYDDIDRMVMVMK